MEEIGVKLQKAVLIMMSIVSMLGMSSCENRLDSPCPSTGEGKAVEVSLCVGIADEVDAVSLAGGTSGTKAGEGVGSGSGLNVRLQSSAKTKAAVEDPLATAKPDKLYGLEIWQYDAGGNFKTGKGVSYTSAVEIGSSFTVTLEALDNCQLVIIARGYNGSAYTVGSLSGKSFSAVQSTTATSSIIEGIKNEGDIKAMPYILHLPKVNVTSAGEIQSPDGTDVRILLRRLATRLTLSWKNESEKTGYTLEQVLLQSIPVDYRLLKPVNDDTYPSLLDQYTTIQVASVSDEGSYTCWVPSVVRGESAYASSAYYRTKANAPKGSAYATFISRHKSDGGNETDSRKKLNYRVYLGGSTSKEFDLYDNTNYIYNVEMSHNTLPVDDRRITIIDPIPASQNNNNIVPTANCFMVKPGGAFCFNPYNYTIKGVAGGNTILRDWCGLSGTTFSTPIKSVKVLWQTLEDGDLGDPALGVVNKYAPQVPAEDDHTNIVELKNGDSLTDARIYCRVAPNTTGGSGLIAAYDGENGTGNILWSWHVWVTDYSPSATTDATILLPDNQRILKLQNGATSYKPIMDRCLGAYDGYVSVPSDILDMSRANGFHYQRARKDPFPGSYTAEKIANQYKFTINAALPPKHCLNRYKADGITWVMPTGLNFSSVHHAYQHPEAFGQPQNQEWSSNPSSDANGRPTWSDSKTVHDPCPAGWRVPTQNELQVLINRNSSDWNTILSNSEKNGGVLLKYDNTTNGTYMRFSGYPADLTTLNNVGYTTFLAITASNAKMSSVFVASRSGGIVEGGGGLKFVGKDNRDAQNIRCIQE